MNAIDLARDLLNDLENDHLTVALMVDAITKIAEAYIEEKTDRVHTNELGIGDSRCGYVLLEAYPQAIIADGSFSPYYAGFDYVDKACVTKIGRYTIYSNDDSRVDEHLEIYAESK